MHAIHALSATLLGCWVEVSAGGTLLVWASGGYLTGWKAT